MTEDLLAKQDLLSKKFIKGLEEYGLSYDDIKNSGWKYCGGNVKKEHKKYFALCFPSMSLSDIPHEDHCVCGHHIVENCFITDSTETQILVLGNCCIKKFVPMCTRTCEICKSPHRNRKDNKCTTCRKVCIDYNITKEIINEIKSPLKDLTIYNKMTHLNIHPFDRSGLSPADKQKLNDYEVTDFLTLRTGDHFRYTNNKYQEKGQRKLAYGVVHGVDRENKVLEVNGYITSDQDEKYPNWNIYVTNRYKQYILYKKTRNNNVF